MSKEERACPRCAETRRFGSTRCWTCDDTTAFDACPKPPPVGPQRRPDAPPAHTAPGTAEVDTIVARLRAATADERKSVARALKVELTGPIEVDITTLSRELRAAAGNSFANLVRGAHELPYREILVDLVAVSGDLAGFARVKTAESLPEECLEDYILEAASFASVPTEQRTPELQARAQARAVEALRGRLRTASGISEPAAKLSILAGGAVAVALGVSALPFAVAVLAWNWSSPAHRRTLPAVLGLIAVRERLERQRDHEASALAELHRQLDDATSSAPDLAGAYEAFAESRLDDARSLATSVHALTTRVLAIAQDGLAQFPEDERFKETVELARRRLDTIESFLVDIDAFLGLHRGP